MSEPLLTASEVARLLAVAPQTVYRWVGQGILPCTRLTDNVIRFERGEVETWLLTKSS